MSICDNFGPLWSLYASLCGSLCGHLVSHWGCFVCLCGCLVLWASCLLGLLDLYIIGIFFNNVFMNLNLGQHVPSHFNYTLCSANHFQCILNVVPVVTAVPVVPVGPMVPEVPWYPSFLRYSGTCGSWGTCSSHGSRDTVVPVVPEVPVVPLVPVLPVVPLIFDFIAAAGISVAGTCTYYSVKYFLLCCGKLVHICLPAAFPSWSRRDNWTVTPVCVTRL